MQPPDQHAWFFKTLGEADYAALMMAAHQLGAVDRLDVFLLCSASGQLGGGAVLEIQFRLRSSRQVYVAQYQMIGRERRLARVLDQDKSTIVQNWITEVS